MPPRLTVAPTAEDAARLAAERVAAAVAAARAARGVAHVALAGGTTPRRAYELLAPMLGDAAGLHLWFGDERCVPPDHPESNYRLVAESLLARVPIPAERVHRIPGELDPAVAATAYAEELRSTVPADGGEFPVLDLALLGLGEDGHTASLFPGDPALDRHDLCLPVVAAKPPPHRITLGLDVLRSARAVVVLAVGAGKAAAVAAVMRGPDRRVPASLLPDGRTEMIVDRAAA